MQLIPISDFWRFDFCQKVAAFSKLWHSRMPLWTRSHQKFLQTNIAKLIHRTCNSYQFRLLELRKAACSFTSFWNAFGYISQIILQIFHHNKCYAIQFWSPELQILSKSGWFLESIAYSNVTLRLFWLNFFKSFFKISIKINVMLIDFGLLSLKFCPKVTGFSKAGRTRKSLWDAFD